MLCVRRRSDAGPAGRVRCWQVQCREPKTGQHKFKLYYEDDPLCPSRYIIYLMLQVQTGPTVVVDSFGATEGGIFCCLSSLVRQMDMEVYSIN